MVQETVILVHGLWMTGLEMTLIKLRLQDQGYIVHQFSYRMVRKSLEENCLLLRDFVMEHTLGTTHVIAHSLGGVLTLHTLRHFPEMPVNRVVCLGSPLVDSEAGRRIIRFSAGQAIIGKTLPEAIFSQPLGAWSGSQQVGVIAGTHWGLGFGLVLGSLPKPNDGLVAVKETCLPGINDHIELDVSHNGMLISSDVAAQCEHFVRRGQFLHSQP